MNELENKLNRHLSFLAQDEHNLNLILEISTCYAELQDFDSAQIYLDKAERILPDSTLSHQGLLFLYQQKFAEAKDRFLQVIAILDNPVIRYNLAYACFGLQEFTEAEHILAAVIEIEKDYFPDAMLLMARIFHHRNMLPEAIDILNKILEQDNENDSALGLLSLLLLDTDDIDGAQETSANALSLNSDNYEAKLVKVILGVLTLETTIEEVEELLTVNPNDSRLWFALGNVQMSQSNFSKAVKALEQAIILNPTFYDCYVMSAWCYLLNDKLSKAEKVYEHAIKLADDIAEGWSGLAIVAGLKKDFSQAEHYIARAHTLDPTCFLTEIARCIYLSHSNPKQANKHLVKALKDNKMSIGDKLALIIEDIDGPQELH